MSDLRIVVELTGGLANQLFQWAAGHELARESGAALVLDASLVERPDGRGVQIAAITTHSDVIHPSARARAAWVNLHRTLPRRAVGLAKRIAHARPRRERTHATLDAARASLAAGRSVRLEGLFQDADLLYRDREGIADIVRTRLPESPIEPYAAVHVRRGDYVSNAKYLRVFGVCSEQYYRDAIALLDPALPIRFVSDDLDWCRALVETLDERGGAISFTSGADHFEDLSVLAGARSLVLANSTFSWWGAFLSNAAPIVRPDPWFTDPARDRGIARDDWMSVPRG